MIKQIIQIQTFLKLTQIPFSFSPSMEVKEGIIEGGGEGAGDVDDIGYDEEEEGEEGEGEKVEEEGEGGECGESACPIPQGLKAKRAEEKKENEKAEGKGKEEDQDGCGEDACPIPPRRHPPQSSSSAHSSSSHSSCMKLKVLSANSLFLLHSHSYVTQGKIHVFSIVGCPHCKR